MQFSIKQQDHLEPFDSLNTTSLTSIVYLEPFSSYVDTSFHEKNTNTGALTPAAQRSQIEYYFRRQMPQGLSHRGRHCFWVDLMMKMTARLQLLVLMAVLQLYLTKLLVTVCHN